MDYLWLGFGISILLLIHVLNLLASNLEPVLADRYAAGAPTGSFRLFEYVAPLFLILYGMPTFITGAACKFKPMLWGGLVCWACSIITVYTTIKIDLLLTAFSSIVAWFIPGIIMERDYRIYKRGQAKDV